MMTNLQILTELWNWRSPAWWMVLIASAAYAAVARRRGVSPRQIVLFAISAAAFLIALASPLAALASRYLFSAHMAQHLLLLLIVPLCAMLALPTSTKPLADARARGLSQSAAAIGWFAGVGIMWFWHIPTFCDASMSSAGVFDVQTVSLVAAGTAFWRPVFSPIFACRLQPHVAAGYLFAGCAGCSLLGIYLTFSPVSVCPLYEAPPGTGQLLSVLRDQWGLTHHVDQQIGGLLMWVPACMVYLGAILATLGSWYEAPQQTQTA
jgi:cytochrome c oxidase assembly factor CtaG